MSEVQNIARDVQAALPDADQTQIFHAEGSSVILTGREIFEVYQDGENVFVQVAKREAFESVGDDTMWWATVEGESNPHFTDEGLEPYRYGDEAEYLSFDADGNRTTPDWAQSVVDVWNSNQETPTGVEPGQYGWIDFEHMETDEDPERFYIEIFSTDQNGRYEEEIAVICHRTVGGKFPLDGDVANGKREQAQRIVDALNATLVTA